MPWTVIPEGEERQVKIVNSSSIDGAPIAYIVVLSAIVTALSFIPFSIVLGSGGSMPLSQGVFPLLGWLLGPIGGAIASAIGSMVGAFLAPYTAGIPIVSVLGATVSSFIAGIMIYGKGRRGSWLFLIVLFLLAFYIYGNRAIVQNGIPVNIFLAGNFIELSSFLLFILPTRRRFAGWIGDSNLALVALGLFAGTWIASGLSHLCLATITYSIFNWPKEVWLALIPIIPFENLIRSLVGSAIGTGVIAGLRAISLVRSAEAIY